MTGRGLIPGDGSSCAWSAQGLAAILQGLYRLNLVPWLGIILLVLIPVIAFCLPLSIIFSIDGEFVINSKPSVVVRCFG